MLCSEELARRADSEPEAEIQRRDSRDYLHREEKNVKITSTRTNWNIGTGDFEESGMQAAGKLVKL